MKYLKNFKLWILFVAIFYTIFGFIIIPWFITNETPSLLKDKLGLHVEIGKAKFNPYIFKLEIHDVLLKDLKDYPVAGFKTLVLDYNPIWLLGGTFLFEKLSIDSPKFYATIKKDGKLNLENIIPPRQSSRQNKDDKTKHTLPTITLQNLVITDGNIKFSDLRTQKEFHVNLGPYNFQAYDISTKKNALNAHNFFTKINKDGELFWEGGVRLNPLKLYGTINIKNLKLPSFYKYAIPNLDASLSKGTLDVKIPYKIDFSKKFKLNINGAKANISNLSFLSKTTDKKIAELTKINLAGFNLAWPEQKIVVNSLNIDNPYLYTLLNKNKELTLVKSFSNNLEKDKNTTAQAKTPSKWSFLLKDTYLNNANIDFVDSMGSKPIKTTLTQASLHVKDISLDKTRPISFNLDTGLNKATKINSSGKIVVKPFKLSSDLQIENFDLLEYKAYAKPYINFQIKDAKIDTKSHIEAIMKDKININALSDISVKNLLLHTKNNKKFLGWEKLDISKINFLWPQQKITIEKLNLNKLDLSASIDKNKDISLIKIFAPKNKNSTQAKSDSKPWEFLLKETNLENTKINFVDNMNKKSITTKLTQMSLHVKNISLDNKTPIDFQMNTKINKSSQLKSSGSVLTKPFKLSSNIILKDFDAVNYAAYVQPYLNFKITNAKIDTTTHVEITLKNKLNMKIASNADIKNLSLKTNNNQRFLEWKNLNINKLKYIHNPMKLSIKSMELDKPYIKVHIAKNGTTNFTNLVKNSDSSQKKSKSQPLQLKIGPMKLINGISDFSDFSLPLLFKTHIHELNGLFSTLDFQKTTPSTLNLKGKIDKYGYAKIHGTLSPFNIKENAQLNLLFKNIDLNSMTPYSDKFLGYNIRSGKLSMDLKYKTKQAKLIGDNKINIDTLILGDKVESPDALSLPLELAVALLKDANGQIDINMPVTGNLNNPKFSYGSVIWRAVGNLITGIVTAPFRFLGSMLGVNGDDLKAIDFDKGSFALISTEYEKLDNLNKILSKRPGIKLSIAGGYDKKIDTYELQKQKFKTIVNKELAKDTNNAKKDVYGTALKSLYLKEFTLAKYETLKKDFIIVQKEDDNKTKKTKEVKKEKEPQINIVAFNNALQKEITTHIKIDKKELEKLANKRTESLRKELVTKYKIAKERIKILPPKVKKAKRDRWIESELEIAI